MTAKYSPTTEALLAALDKVIAEQDKPGEPGPQRDENELMMTHVRSVLNSDSTESLFTEAVLKMAAVELIRDTTT